MNTDQIVKILEMEGVDLAAAKLTPAVAAKLVKDKSLTNEQLVSSEDGTIKHYIRTKIGFFVDLFWIEVEPYVEQAIALAIPAAREIAGVPEPATQG